MTISVGFYLSYDPLKRNFISIERIFFQYENTLLTRMLSITLHVYAKVLLHVWSYDFYDTTLSTE